MMQLVARPVYHKAHHYANVKYFIMKKSPAPGHAEAGDLKIIKPDFT